ncbi:VWA domain-containing protein [Methanocella sp. MCL-LM]|uniref:VWA domain-containing protein n=1 Tax=Methanocella sp. MCL-LM TaxID=3412035 RepID=UPI003C724CEA
MTVYIPSNEPEIRDALAMPGIREVLAVPHALPRETRETLATILARELVLGETYELRDPDQATSHMGPAIRLLNAARYTEAWARLKSLSAKSRMIALLAMKAVLDAILETFDEIQAGRLPAESQRALLEFKLMIVEMFGLHGRKPGVSREEKSLHNDLRSKDSRARAVNDVLYRRLVPRLDEAAEELADSADAIEIMSLLSGGRGWDYAMIEKHEDPLYDIRRYSKVIRRNSDLMALIDDLGRSSEGVDAGGRRHLRCGRLEVHSIVTSSNLHYLLPSELIKLQDNVLKYLFFARWTEGKLLTYQLTAHGKSETGDKKRKGPVIALVDTSGSMDGIPGILAKSITLATVRMFLQRARKIKVVLFSAAGQLDEIDLPEESISGFLDFLRASFGGGTDFNTALKAGIEALKTRQYTNADILFITDGMSRVTDKALIEEWRSLKEASSSQIFTVIVGNDQAGGLEELSDQVYFLGRKPARHGNIF